jgi:hypothetical protein
MPTFSARRLRDVELSIMTTRQQRRAAARRQTTQPPRQSKWKYAAQTALRLSAPVRRLPWWADVLGVLAALFVLWEIYVDTRPIVTAHPSSVQSSDPLPFIVKNPSIIFDMTNVVLTCQLLGDVWGGVPVPPHTWVTGSITTNLTGRILSKERGLTISRFGGLINFPCSTEGIESAQMAGSPMRLEEMHVVINMEYQTLVFSRTFISDVFTFKRMNDGSYEWFEGQTVN